MATVPSEVPLRRSRHSKSYRERSRPTLRISSEERGVEAPDLDEVRRLRTAHYSKQPENRHSTSEEQMATSSTHKRNGSIDSKSTKDSPALPRESRTRSHSDHSSRHHKPRKEHGHGTTIYVYKYIGENEELEPTPVRRTPQVTGSTFIGDRLRSLRSVGLPLLQAPVQPTAPRHDDKQEDFRDIYNRQRSFHQVDGPNHRRGARIESHDQAASPSNGRPTTGRSASVHESSASVTRPTVLRSSTTTSRNRLPNQSRPSVSSSDADIKSNFSYRKPERTLNILDSLFGPPKPQEPQPNIQCLTCLSDDILITKSAKLACGHRMCHTCLRRIFTMSVTDPAHMPPRCCTAEHIPLKHVDKLFDIKFKMKWNKKYQEYTTKNRIYCPMKGCGEWIKPANIHVDTSGGANGGRKYGKCNRCRTKVCATCNGKWHNSRECPKDEATARFADMAKEEGWQRCFNCSATVELKEGCNHMTCRCRAEFCMICGAKWKTCDCPWFNYQVVENDRLLHMNVVQARRNPRAMNAPRAYQEELEMRREQERLDEAVARGIQRRERLVLEDDESEPNEARRGIANAPGNIDDRHFWNDHFWQPRIIPEYHPAPPSPPPPPIPPSPPTHPPVPSEPTFMPDPPTNHSPPPQHIFRQHTNPFRRNTQIRSRPSGRIAPEGNSIEATPVEMPIPTAPSPPPPPIEESDTPLREVPKTRSSRMAGLNKITRQGRVNEWRRHVEGDSYMALSGYEEVESQSESQSEAQSESVSGSE